MKDYLKFIKINILKRNDWLILFSIFIFILLTLYQFLIKINGPFIFGDEPEYHWLAGEIYYYKQFHSHQYNPLYPILISITFYFNDLITHYNFIKIINLIAYVSIIFPSYLLARDILKNNSFALLIASVIALSSLGSYIHMVWADPLFYTLMCWAYFFINRHLRSGQSIELFYSGIFIGLAFLTKQAAIFLYISIVIYSAFTPLNKENKNNKNKIILLTIGVFLFILPWIIRNYLYGQSSLGYSSMFSLFWLAIIKTPLKFVSDFFLGIGYSFGYTIYLYCGVGIYLLIYAAIGSSAFKKLNYINISVLSRIILIHFGTVLITSELLIVPYGSPPMAVGRYTDVIFPVASIIISKILIDKKIIIFSNSFIFAIALNCFIILLLFTPLTLIKAFGVTTNSGVSILNLFWTEFLWDTPDYSFYNQITFAIGMTLILLITLIYRNYSIFITYLFWVLLGFGAHNQAVKLGATVAPTNKLFIWLNQQNINPTSISYDKSMKDFIHYYIKFWHSKEYKYVNFIDAIELYNKVQINFSEQISKSIRNQQLNIKMYSNEQSSYKQSSGFGFDGFTTLKFSKCSVGTNEQHFVYDNKPQKFYYDLPPGNYILHVKNADPTCLGLKSNFWLHQNNENSINVSSFKEYSLPFVINQKDRGLELTIDPKHDSVWSMNYLSIELVNNNSNKYENNYYYVSNKVLSLPIIYNSSGYRVYKLK